MKSTTRTNDKNKVGSRSQSNVAQGVGTNNISGLVSQQLGVIQSQHKIGGKNKTPASTSLKLGANTGTFTKSMLV